MEPFYERDGITIYNADNRDVLPLLEPVASVITDPPYGFGLATWDNAPDMVDVFAMLKRLEPEFVSVFCQMPFMLDVANAAREHKFHYLEHISWVKRSTTPSARLSRSHESILMYAPGKARKFHVTRGPYEDVRLPGVLVDTVSLEGIHRQLGFYRQMIQNGDVKSSPKGVTAISHLGQNSRKVTKTGTTNFTNVWSFLAPNRAKKPGSDKLVHVSMKPVEICKRLIEMTTLPGETVLDPFMGTGPVMEAAMLTGRKAIGIDANEQYCEIAVKRLESRDPQLALEGIA